MSRFGQKCLLNAVNVPNYRKPCPVSVEWGDSFVSGWYAPQETPAELPALYLLFHSLCRRRLASPDAPQQQQFWPRCHQAADGSAPEEVSEEPCDRGCEGSLRQGGSGGQQHAVQVRFFLVISMNISMQNVHKDWCWLCSHPQNYNPFHLLSSRFPSTSPLKPIPCPAPASAPGSIKKRPSFRDKEGFFKFRSFKKQEKETQVSWIGYKAF